MYELLRITLLGRRTVSQNARIGFDARRVVVREVTQGAPLSWHLTARARGAEAWQREKNRKVNEGCE